MLKRLWLILGPVFCALLMVAALLFFYPINHKHNYTEEKKAAVSLIHSIDLFLISAQVNGCVLMWCIQQFWLKNMTVITDPTF